MQKYKCAIFRLVGLAFFGAVGLESAAHALSPPWNIYHSRLQSTIGAVKPNECDRPVDVRPLSLNPDKTRTYHQDIIVCDVDQALALATLMNHVEPFGNLNVEVRVYHADGDLAEPRSWPESSLGARELLEKALKGNVYFSRFIEKKSPMRKDPILAVIFQKMIVQYRADDISEAFGNRNEVAAHAFRDVLHLERFERPFIYVGTEIDSH